MNIFYTSTPARSRAERVPSSAGSRARSEGSRPYLISTKTQARRAGIPAQKATQLFPHEPEDARLTGSTRSLFRRLLALNLPAGSHAVSAVVQTTQITETVVMRQPATPVPTQGISTIRRVRDLSA